MKEQIYKITHKYDRKPQYSIKIMSKENPTKFAVYIQFIAEKWIHESISLDNHTIADVLIKFYNCRLPTDIEFCQEVKPQNIIDMYWDRERLCGNGYHEMMLSDKYPRNGLKEYLQKIQDGNGNYQGLLTNPKHYTDYQYFKNLSQPEKKYIFEKTLDSFEKMNKEFISEINFRLEANKERIKLRLILQILLLYLFNRNDRKDKILSHLIQDILISTKQDNQADKIIELLQHHYILKDIFIGNLKDNVILEERIADLLIKNANNELDF